MSSTESKINAWIDVHRKDENLLHAFVKRMPKGGDLHHHFDGSLLTENLMKSAVEQGLWISTEDFTVSKTAKEGKEWEYLPNLVQDEIWENFQKDWLCAWSVEDFEGEETIADEHFFGIFPKFYEVISGYTEDGLLETKARCLEEKVSYLETHFENFPHRSENDFLEDLAKTWIIAAVWDENLDKEFDAAFRELHTPSNQKFAEATCRRIEEVHKRLRLDDESFTLRYLMYVLRLLPAQLVFEQMYFAFLACEKSDLLVGINLVGAENHPVTQSDKVLHFKMISFFRKKFPSVSVALHAGELTKEQTENFLYPHTISQSVQAGAKRIGHGVAIFWEWDEEDTLTIMREKGIPLELNFGSNEFILGVKPEDHPWRRYQKAGVPLVFGSDDLGILRSDRNREVVRFFSKYNGNYSEFKEMALNGIRYSFLKNDEQKERLLARLLVDFDTFEKTFEDEQSH